MTEHFTREDVIAAGGIVHRDGNVFFTNVDKLNAMFTAIDKKREAQGAAAKCVWGGKIEHLHEGPPSKLVGALLYTHALPAQPAEPVNAELVKALKKLLEQYDELAEEDNSGWILAGELAKANHAREVLSRAQAAPAVGAPDGYVLVPVEPTPEMIRQGRITPCTADEMDADDDYRAVYKAMIASAQPAPSTDICQNCAGQGWEPSVYKGKVPCSFCQPAPSTAGERKKVVEDLLMYAGDNGYGHIDYADTMRHAAALLQSTADHIAQNRKLVAALPVGELTLEQITRIYDRYGGDMVNCTRAIERELAARSQPTTEESSVVAGAQPVREPMIDDLIKALADVRDLFPIPERGNKLEHAWMEAVAFPESVPAYVRACIAPAAMPVGELPEPFHPSASHINPDYRDGWNAALAAASSQPVREPLTDSWILERCAQSWVFETAKQWVRMTEAAHGITKKGTV